MYIHNIYIYMYISKWNTTVSAKLRDSPQNVHKNCAEKVSSSLIK